MFYPNTIKISAIILFLILVNGLHAQTTIWQENFSYSNNTTTGTATGLAATSWSSGNGVGIQGNSIETISSRTNGYWRTAPINVVGFRDLQISFSVNNDNPHKHNKFTFRYRLNSSGPWVNLVSPIAAPNNNYTLPIPNSTTLELEALFDTNNGNRNYTLDNILLTGIPPACANTLNYEFYDLVPPGYTVDNIPTTGALATGQIGNFNVGALQNAVDPGDPDIFSIRYKGYVHIPTSGNYTFYTDSDDGSGLFIDGVKIVDNDGNHGMLERSGNVMLSSGLHEIEVLFFENTGNEQLLVGISGPGISKMALPFSHLYSDCIGPVVDPDEDNEPPTIEATGDQRYCPGEAISIVESVSISNPDNAELSSVFIQITTNYDSSGDVLSLTGSHPGITAFWSGPEGKLSLVGSVTVAQFEAAIRDVVFNTTAPSVSGTIKEFSIVLAEANYLATTQHYYEFVPAIGITWTAARDAAAMRTFYGLQGYLATLTTAEEAALLGEQATGAGWIGASDAAVEGQWRWVTGPEAGTLFWSGAVNGSTTPPYNYANWNTSEPNNSGGEDYAHINAPGQGFDGSWNDLSNTGASSGNYQPKGYLVEYGGMPGDPPAPNISAVTRILVDNVAPTASNLAPITIYCHSELPTPDISLVTYAADNCTTDPTVTFLSDSNDGGTDPEIITRTYRITDAAGNSTDITQTITIAPFAITASPNDQIIFVGDSGSFSVSAGNADTYQWQVSMDGGTVFNTITDGADYGGTQTATLTVNAVSLLKNGYRYRVLVSHSASVCAPLISASALLTAKVRTVITNRGTTYRVNQ